MKLPSGSLISYMSSMVKEKGGINMAQGLPGFSPPIELLNSLSEFAHKNVHQYPPGIGNFKILDLLTNHYSNHKISRDNLLVTQGATEAISLLYLYIKNIINQDFSVMSFSPAYESYSQLPCIFGQKFIEIEFDTDGNFDETQVEKYIISNNVKLFFIASPGNPYGKIISEDNMNKILDICFRNKCYVIIDAVYREIYFKTPPYIPMDISNPYLFYVNSFSKLLSITGWRIGYMIANSNHMSKIRLMHDYTGLCANSVMQEAIAKYLEDNNMGQKYISELRVELLNSFHQVSTVLKSLNFQIPQTDGGYFIWAKLPPKHKNGFETAVDFYKKTKVATVPGIHFSKNANKYIRFNIARQKKEIEFAIKALKKYFS